MFSIIENGEIREACTIFWDGDGLFGKDGLHLGLVDGRGRRRTKGRLSAKTGVKNSEAEQKCLRRNGPTAAMNGK